MTTADRRTVDLAFDSRYPAVMDRPRIAVVCDQDDFGREAGLWLRGDYAVVPVGRGRYLAADLAAARADVIVLEAVHATEAGWLIAWLRAQPRLARTPLLLIVPTVPASRTVPGVAFARKPLQRPALLSKIGALLRHSRPR